MHEHILHASCLIDQRGFTCLTLLLLLVEAVSTLAHRGEGSSLAARTHVLTAQHYVRQLALNVAFHSTQAFLQMVSL